MYVNQVTSGSEHGDKIDPENIKTILLDGVLYFTYYTLSK